MGSPIMRHFFSGILVIVLFSTVVNSAEIAQGISTNDKSNAVSTSSPSLDVEARGDSDGVDMNAIEESSKSSPPKSPIIEKSDKQPIILGTSKVAIVYSERKGSKSDKDKSIKAPRVVYPQKQASTSLKQSSPDRNWRGVRVSPRDSYLDAFEHSQTSKDVREAVISVDVKPKIPKLIRRDYSEGPVYRHPHEQYGGPKDSSSTYSLPQEVNNRLTTTKNIARISYGGPTPEPFYPTPSDSYSLPIQSSANFNNNNNNGFHGSPQITYGSPTPQTSYGSPSPQTSYGSPSPQVQIYGLPNHSYSKAPTAPFNSYGPPNTGYSPAGTPHQAYGPPPSSSYGAPFAIQNPSQQLSSLMPSIDFSWPFALKLNAFTLAKILLKLVIFKMIVKFIALICLLLFIPKLEIVKKVESNDDSDDSDDGRTLFSKDSALERLNILTAFVTSAIEKYETTREHSAKSVDDCTGFICRVKRFFIHEETWNDYVTLFKRYVAEESGNGDQQVRTNHVDS
ncbi:uncharacterized protein [Venturia canescens]|uniref:uncharacterized protein isoform X2 n=1 Tax=Venturia canescens TaxID=32260 RepID=UPI001C9C002B|nr:uncharacterized protein LOC122410347 isoform X2 [Venturia canescens]